MNIQSINSFSSVKIRNVGLQKNQFSKNGISQNLVLKSSKQSQISFSGVGEFFNKFRVISANCPEKVFKKLSKRKFGAYVLTQKGYVPMSPKNFRKFNFDNCSEVIMKQGLNKYNLTELNKDGSSTTKVFKYREGVSPSFIISLIKRGLPKATLIADDGVQTLTVPKSAQKNLELVEQLEKSPSCDSEVYTIQVMPNDISKFLYDISSKMIEGVKSSGIKLTIK